MLVCSTFTERIDVAVDNVLYELGKHVGSLKGRIEMQEEKKNLRPLADRVLIERDPIEEKSPGGILIPASAQSRPDRGTVVAVGRGLVTPAGVLIEPSVKVGDVVLFGKYAGTAATATTKRVLVREDEILAVVETEA